MEIKKSFVFTTMLLYVFQCLMVLDHLFYSPALGDAGESAKSVVAFCWTVSGE